MSVKQVIVVRSDLGMRKGKMIAQGGHASLKVFLDWSETKPRIQVKPMPDAAPCFVCGIEVSLYALVADVPVCPRCWRWGVQRGEVSGPFKPHNLTSEVTFPVTEDMREWIEGSFAKICVRATSEDQLLTLHTQALQAGLPCALIQDSGKTEFHGVPTFTALAIGPAKAEVIDPITGELKLL